jgi:membrane protein
MSLRRYLALLKDTFTAWKAHKAQRLGAALAYYTIFSLAPLLIIFIGIAALAFGQDTAETQLIERVQSLLGTEGADFVQALIGSARHSGSGAAATLLGLGTLLFGALGLFVQLQDALNTIWDVEPDLGRGIRRAVRDRVVSLVMMLGVGFLLLVSLLVSTALATAGRYFAGLLPVPATVLEALNLAISFAFSTLLFALLFKYLPDVSVAWGDVWHGAALTSLLFTIGKFLIALYLGITSVGSVYGTAGSLVALLVWVYFSAQIILFGAEFTQVYARKYRTGSDARELPVSP